MCLIQWQLVLLGIIGCVFAWLPVISQHLSDESIITARFCALLLVDFTFIHRIGAPFPRYYISLRTFVYGVGLSSLHFVTGMIRRRLNVAHRSGTGYVEKPVRL